MNIKNEHICFVLFGETGHGKSTLGNALLGKEFFKTNDTVQSVTKEIYGCQGVDKSSDLFVIDTPGINDTEGKDNEYLKNIAIYLKKRNDIKGIVIVLNFSLKTAVQKSAEKSFKTIFRIFKSKIICSHIIIAFTHFYAGRKPPERNEQGELKENIFNIFQTIFYDMFHQKCPINSLPFYFLDIESIDDIESESQMEIDSMITTIFSKKPINSSIIQIKDNYNIKDEISTSKTIEDIDRFEGDYIIKKIKKYKTTIIKFYDSSLKDSISETLVEEKEVKILNENLIEQRKKLQSQKEKEKEMQKKMKKQFEDHEIKRKQSEELMERMKMENKKREEELDKLKKEIKRNQEEREIMRKEEEIKNKIKIMTEKIEKLQKQNELLKKKIERVKICKKIKEYISNPKHESLTSYVSELDETFEYGLFETPEDDKDNKIELLKTETIDLSDKAFTKVTGRINGVLVGKVILGWKLINRHYNSNGGSWERNIKILGTNKYDFTFTSCFWRGLHWTLELYGLKIPDDYDENKNSSENVFDSDV